MHAPAVGSGVPEVISYLNGITIHGVFSLKNLVVKFVSLIFAVSSGLPTATQGPIIALGYGDLYWCHLVMDPHGSHV